VTDLAESMRAEELSRKARVARRARETLAEARLPPRMEMWERTVGRQKRALLAEQERRGGLTEHHTFRPRINAKVPDFARLTASWERALAKRKGELAASTRAVRSNPPSFYGPGRRSAEAEKRQAKERARRAGALREEEGRRADKKRKERAMRAALNAAPAVRSTSKHALMASSTESLLRLRAAQEAEAREADAQRSAREKRANAQYAPLFAQAEKERRAAFSGYLSLEMAQVQAAEKAKEMRATWARKLDEAERRYHAPREGRECLFQRSTKALHRDKATREALARVAATARAAGADDDHDKAPYDGLFDDDELALLGE